MSTIILSGLTYKIKRDFLKIPSIIYSKKDCPQDKKTEKLILNGKHIISKDIQIMPFVAYDDTKPVARCLVTLYKNDNKAYLGYFDSIADTYVSDKLFQEIEKYARDKHKNEMVGPVDASFWINYRFRVMENQNEGYNRHFTGEPYNKDYYIRLWNNFGFEVLNTYKSNFYRHIRESDKFENYLTRKHEKLNEGYVIRSSNLTDFEDDLNAIYMLITKLYKTFPMYKHIDIDQFKHMFKSYKNVLNLRMVKLAFKDGELVGFVICFPNYGNNKLGKLTFRKLANLLYIVNNVSEYVVMYCGVDYKHLGLGKVLAEYVKDDLRINGCSSIGALIKQGKVTGAYYKELIVDNVEYVTFRKKVENANEV